MYEDQSKGRDIDQALDCLGTAQTVRHSEPQAAV